MVRSSGGATRSIATPATADFLDPHTILVESDNQAEHATVSGDNIASGTQPVRPDGVAFDDHRVPDSDLSLFSATHFGQWLWFRRWLGRLFGPSCKTTGFRDDVPVADAVEQQRPATDPVLDEAVEPPGDPPLEATASDWQQQRETVDVDPEEDR